jgi:hypothetical protein
MSATRDSGHPRFRGREAAAPELSLAPLSLGSSPRRIVENGKFRPAAILANRSFDELRKRPVFGRVETRKNFMGRVHKVPNRRLPMVPPCGRRVCLHASGQRFAR